MGRDTRYQKPYRKPEENVTHEIFYQHLVSTYATIAGVGLGINSTYIKERGGLLIFTPAHLVQYGIHC